ncbi:MAG: F0F1 ATP synthase subunit B [Lachnospiraceae bacterium]|nr:F0F1 ATP synthase subunit B [Lachnospiraceae bacterium]
MIVAIFVLMLILGHFLFNPARKFLQDRSDRIKNDLDTAAKDKAEAISLKTEYEEKIRGIDKQAEEIMADARKRALASEADILAKAREEANRIIERANQEAELEKQKVADQVKTEMISIASMMAGKVVSANIDTTVQGALVDETLREIGESTWLS